MSLVPVLLIGLWAAGRLEPFVPALDAALVRAAVRALLSEPWSVAEIAGDAVDWCVVLALAGQVRGSRGDDRFVLASMPVILGLGLVLVDHPPSRNDAAGAVLAAVLWFGALRRLYRRELVVAALLVGRIALGGLAPFVWRAEPAPFLWVPFAGALSSNLLANVAAMVEKAFLYGSLVWWLGRLRIGWWWGTAAGVVLVAAVETAQTRLVGRTPEITDPMLVLAAGATLRALSRSRHSSRPKRGTHDGEPRLRPTAPGARNVL